jgi:SagB-type dehydrogenase family enzyme
MISAATYHQATAYLRQAMPRHQLDWSCQPATVKHYPHADTVFTQEVERQGDDVVGDLLRPAAEEPVARLGRDLLSALLDDSYGVTAARRMAGGTFRFRSAASAGALYPAEIYCVVHDVEGLESGIYYFHPEKPCLASLQPWSGPPPQLAAGRPAGCTLVVSGIFFRSAWKYHLRAYRYLLLDAGHLTENLHLCARRMRLDHEVLYDFDDRQVGSRLGLDGQREVPLVMVRLFADRDKPVSPDDTSARPLVPDVARSVPVSSGERVIPELVEIHRAGCGFPPDAETAFLPTRTGCVQPRWQDIPVAANVTAERPFIQVLVERRSRRNFVEGPVAADAFWRLLGMVATGLARRHPSVYPHAATLGCGFVAGDHTPLSPGFYLLDGDRRRYGRVVEGAVGGAVASACLEQRWLSAAGLQFLFVSDLARCDRRYGARGYRYAMLNAGRLGQLIYLGATALGFGACGIGAFFDSEVRTLLDLAGEEMPLYLVAAGIVKRRKTESQTNTM